MRQLKVRDMMTSSVITLNEKDGLHKAFIILAVNGISGAPIVDSKEHLLGMLSSMDILRFVKDVKERNQLDVPILSLLAMPPVEEVDDSLLDEACKTISEKRVGDLMVKEVIAVHPDDVLMSVLDMMLENNVRRVPVVEKDRLVGIISRKDIMWGILK
jgi:CBS domain-containing protein